MRGKLIKQNDNERMINTMDCRVKHISNLSSKSSASQKLTHLHGHVTPSHPSNDSMQGVCIMGPPLQQQVDAS